MTSSILGEILGEYIGRIYPYSFTGQGILTKYGEGGGGEGRGGVCSISMVSIFSTAAIIV